MRRTVVGWAAAGVAAVILIPLSAMTAAFLLFSACTRVVARLLEPGSVTVDQLMAFDPVFGWKPRPYLRTFHMMGDLFRLSTDADGWRGRSSLADSDVVVFGDSFAAGYGVDSRYLFADLNPFLRIKPIAIGGYCMVQELLWMQQLAPTLRGKLVVWFVYYGNDLRDNLSPEMRGYRKPFVCERGDTWEIVSSHVTADKWPIIRRSRKGHIHMTTLAELCANTFFGKRAYRACDFLLRQGRDICAAAGAELVVLSIPDKHQLSADGHAFLKSLLPPGFSFDPELPDRRFTEMCQRMEIPFVPGRQFLSVDCYRNNDSHWNELGHRKVAIRMAEMYVVSRERQTRCCPPVSSVERRGDRHEPRQDVVGSYRG